MAIPSKTIDVLIVGAGPTGLTAACSFAAFGINFMIIDKKKTQSKHSKAIGIQPRTLEIFENIGIADSFTYQGTTIKGISVITATQKIYNPQIKTHVPCLSKYPITFLEQRFTEKILIKHLNTLGHQVQWEHELIKSENLATNVTAKIKDKNQKITNIKARWLIAADGAQSTVRQQSKIDFPGGTYNSNFSLADITIDSKVPENRAIANFHDQGFFIFLPFKNGLHRLIASLPKETSSTNFNFSKLRQLVEHKFPIPIKINPKPTWFSNFKIHHRCVTNFQHKNYFFAGDAAHIHSPVGGQGMNTGIQDAHNLAWKIAMTIQKKLKPQILGTYNTERLTFAKSLLKSTDIVFKLLYKNSLKYKILRQIIAPIMLRLLSLSNWLGLKIFQRVSQLNIFNQSFLNCTKLKHGFFHYQSPKPGQRLPYFGKIYQQISPTHFNLILISNQEPSPQINKFIKQNSDLIKLHHFSPTKTITKKFKLKSGMFLARPDHYIVLRSKKLKPQFIEEYFKQIICHDKSQS